MRRSQKVLGFVGFRVSGFEVEGVLGCSGGLKPLLLQDVEAASGRDHLERRHEREVGDGLNPAFKGGIWGTWRVRLRV